MSVNEDVIHHRVATRLKEPDGPLDPVILQDRGGRQGVWFRSRSSAGQIAQTRELPWEMMVDLAPDAILVFDADCHELLYTNEAMRRLFGLSHKKMCSLGLRGMFRSDDSRPVPEQRIIERAFAGACPAMEWSATDSTGRSLSCAVRLSALRDGKRRLVRATVIDISERKRVERAVRKNNDRARVTLEALADAVVTVSADGRVEYLNGIAERLTGWRGEHARGRPVAEVLRLLDVETGLECSLEDWLTPGHAGTQSGLRFVLDRDGRETPVTESVAEIRDRDGELSGTVFVLHDCSTERGLRQQLSYQARHDTVTGLINRVAFESCVNDVINANSHDGSCSNTLLYLDLDQFKLVNDTCGHAAGDDLLAKLAGVMRDHIRASDELARMGGDEFGILLRRCSVEKAVEVADLIRNAIETFRFSFGEQVFRTTASIGIVDISTGETTAAAAMSAADIACYTAKDHGRNRVTVYREHASPARHSEMHWVSRVTRACEENRLLMFYQPIVPITGEASGKHYELLLRMQDEHGRVVQPSAFIPAAERYNLMPMLDRWVVSHALERLAQQRGTEANSPRYTLSINLSGTSLSDEGFLGFVREQLLLNDLAPGAVCFEITETAAIGNIAHAAHFMNELRKLGCLFSLDDFGRGLSSFAYLKDLPVDYVKIDGHFVRNICGDHIDDTMVDAINRVGHAMGIKTVAEHVESPEAALRLAELGVDFAQGFYYSRPAEVRHRETFACI